MRNVKVLKMIYNFFDNLTMLWKIVFWNKERKLKKFLNHKIIMILWLIIKKKNNRIAIMEISKFQEEWSLSIKYWKSKKTTKKWEKKFTINYQWLILLGQISQEQCLERLKILTTSLQMSMWMTSLNNITLVWYTMD